MFDGGSSQQAKGVTNLILRLQSASAIHLATFRLTLPK